MCPSKYSFFLRFAWNPESLLMLMPVSVFSLLTIFYWGWDIYTTIVEGLLKLRQWAAVSEVFPKVPVECWDFSCLYPVLHIQDRVSLRQFFFFLLLWVVYYYSIGQRGCCIWNEQLLVQFLFMFLLNIECFSFVPEFTFPEPRAYHAGWFFIVVCIFSLNLLKRLLHMEWTAFT